VDSVTQVLLGACIGQAIGYRKLGPKAIGFGALCGLLPDLDVLPLRYLGEFAEWKYHRHITHSLWFGPVVGTVMGWGLWRLYGRKPDTLGRWTSITVLALLTHPLLDLFTVYGTQLLAPFSKKRFIIPSVSIIDPVYTFTLLTSLSFIFFKKLRPYATPAAIVGLLLSTSYLFYGWQQNSKAEQIARAQLEQEHIETSDIRAYTTMFQPYLRRVVVHDNNGTMRVGFVSTWNPQPIIWSCQKQAEPKYIDAAFATDAGKTFNWFSSNQLDIVHDKNTLILRDARYGIPGDSVFGWWGLEFPLIEASDGKIGLGQPQRITAMRDASWDKIKNLFRAAFGLENTFLDKQNNGCQGK
jgi:inner membrane protein